MHKNGESQPPEPPLPKRRPLSDDRPKNPPPFTVEWKTGITGELYQSNITGDRSGLWRDSRTRAYLIAFAAVIVIATLLIYNFVQAATH